MATGKNQGRHGPAAHGETNDAEHSASPGELPPVLLDQVVSETSAKLASENQLDPAVRAVLVEVARRFVGQPLVLDPTGAALLEGLLRAEFPLFAERPALLAKAAREVARVLLADPTAHRRLENLWAELAEEAS
jgi:hypothetical protein